VMNPPTGFITVPAHAPSPDRYDDVRADRTTTTRWLDRLRRVADLLPTGREG